MTKINKNQIDPRNIEVDIVTAMFRNMKEEFLFTKTETSEILKNGFGYMLSTEEMIITKNFEVI